MKNLTQCRKKNFIYILFVMLYALPLTLEAQLRAPNTLTDEELQQEYDVTFIRLHKTLPINIVSAQWENKDVAKILQDKYNRDQYRDEKGTFKGYVPIFEINNKTVRAQKETSWQEHLFEPKKRKKIFRSRKKKTVLTITYKAYGGPEKTIKVKQGDPLKIDVSRETLKFAAYLKALEDEMLKLRPKRRAKKAEEEAQKRRLARIAEEEPQK